MNETRRLYRSADDRMIGGVAGGLADYFDIDPVLVRILWLISIPLFGFTIVAYVVMMIVVPLEPPEWQQPSPWQPGGAPVAGAGAPVAGAGATPPGPAGAPEAAAAPGAPSPAAGQAPASYAWEARRQRRAERWEKRGSGNAGGLVFGALLIVVGGLFAWHEIDPSLDLGLLWPLAVIAVGAVLVASSVRFRRGE